MAAAAGPWPGQKIVAGYLDGQVVCVDLRLEAEVHIQQLAHLGSGLPSLKHRWAQLPSERLPVAVLLFLLSMLCRCTIRGCVPACRLGVFGTHRRSSEPARSCACCHAKSLALVAVEGQRLRQSHVAERLSGQTVLHLGAVVDVGRRSACMLVDNVVVIDTEYMHIDRRLLLVRSITDIKRDSGPVSYQ